MASFEEPYAAPVTATTATTGDATQVFATPNSRVGYSICNPSTSVKVYVQERKRSDTTVPTAAQVVASPTFIVQPEATETSGMRQGKIFIASVSTAVDAKCQELQG